MPKYATLAKFKQHLPILSGNPSESDDSYLSSILDKADAMIDAILGRPVDKATRTELVTGDGSRILQLHNGPIFDITTVSEVTYDSARVASKTTVDKGDYFPGGMATPVVSADGFFEEDWRLPSHLVNVSNWIDGRSLPLNYEVVGVFGWDFTVDADSPQDIARAALFAAVWLREKRKDSASVNREFAAGGSVGPFKGEGELMDELRSILAAYIPRIV